MVSSLTCFRAGWAAVARERYRYPRHVIVKYPTVKVWAATHLPSLTSVAVKLARNRRSNKAEYPLGRRPGWQIISKFFRRC